jgi:hypothetical protein
LSATTFDELASFQLAREEFIDLLMFGSLNSNGRKPGASTGPILVNGFILRPENSSVAKASSLSAGAQIGSPDEHQGRQVQGQAGKDEGDIL